MPDRIETDAVAMFVCTMTFTVLGVWGALALARKRAFLALPEARSSHTIPTPVGGGLGIVAAVVLVLGVQAARRHDIAYVAAAPALVVACLVGLRDDAKAFRAGPKMALIIVASALALPVATLPGVDLPYAGRLEFGILALPLSLFWLMAFTNAFNFMDGINGISGITLSVSGAAFAYAGVRAGDPVVATLGACAAGGGLGFLRWNFPRASIFMGDSGSLPMGLLLATTAAMAAQPHAPGAKPALAFPASVLLLGPYVFDVFRTLVLRAREGKPLGQAHNEHLYQRLARGLGGHAPSAFCFGAASAATSTLALLYDRWGDLGRTLSLLLPPLALLASVPWILRKERRSLAAAADSSQPPSR